MCSVSAHEGSGLRTACFAPAGRPRPGTGRVQGKDRGGANSAHLPYSDSSAYVMPMSSSSFCAVQKRYKASRCSKHEERGDTGGVCVCVQGTGCCGDGRLLDQQP